MNTINTKEIWTTAPQHIALKFLARKKLRSQRLSTMPRPATAQQDTATDAAVGGGSRKANKKALNAAKRKTEKTFKQSQTSVGLLVTGELQAAIKRCSRKVQHIAKHCRARNSKFRYVSLSLRVANGSDDAERDPEFDLENDKRLCLYGLNIPDEEDEQFNPGGIMRVTEIWDNPVFSTDGFSSSDLSQGKIGEWLELMMSKTDA